MSSFATELAQWLDRVERPGDFHVSGVCETLAPGLEVEGVGTIALPVLPVQAAQLIAVAQRAPYGRGAQTLVDTEVRRTWQIDPGRIRIRGRGWSRTLQDIVSRVAQGLGVIGTVQADLYKLLVYDEGAFFVSHRDTEKTPGMFATLAIVLPSEHAGGELIVRHQGREVRLDPRASDPSEVGFVAFYADCEHEVLPVISGYRLTLVYNLARAGQAHPSSPPSYSIEQDHLVKLLRQWDACNGVDAPAKLIYSLDHAYTDAGLSFEALKGADASKASTLLAATRMAGFDLHLALVTIEESGIAEYVDDRLGYGGRYRGEDRLEAGEVIDRSQTLSGWRSPGGGEAGLGTLPIADDEIAPPDAFDDRDADEESFGEATGNEGASFERRYRIAALVLWPQKRRLAVINQAGLRTTLPYLSDLAARWSHSGEDQDGSLWVQAHELASHMLATWPIRAWRPVQQPSDAATMLTVLHRLGDTARVESFLADIVAAGVFDKGDGRSIAQSIELLPPARAADLLQRIVAANATRALEACADLLVSAAMSGRGRVDLLPAAAALVTALPGGPKSRPAPASPEKEDRVKPDVVVDLMRALVGIDPALAHRAADTLLEWPRTYSMDRVLVPAVIEIDRSGAVHAPAVERLALACVAHLRARIDDHLEPPADWRRFAKLDCQCPHCRNLAAFLADPGRPAWEFKSLQANRDHVEHQIRGNRCDLDTQTLRKGNPHTLVCTKNQASYQRRVQQRQQDLQHLAALASGRAGRDA